MPHRNIVFVAPVIDEYAARYLRALAKLEDVRVLGVVHKEPPAESARLYHDYVRIPHPTDEREILGGVVELARRHGKPDRILAALEVVQVQVAAAREHLGVPGVSVRTARVFRDKNEMKDALRAAGLPVARHCVVGSERGARQFVEAVGLPVVVKPLDGVGAHSTMRARTAAELFAALERMKASPSAPVLLEEMLVGEEHSFEALTLGGEPRAWSFSKYVPGCLEVIEKPWVQWACILPRDVDTPVHRRARELGFAVIRALGLDEGMTHMEWFERADGSLVVGEIAQRPPGPQLCQMTGIVNGVDIHRAWARCVVDSVLDAPWERSCAAGTVFIRGQGRGRVTAVRGVAELEAALGSAIVEVKVPAIGTPKSTSYEGEGYVVVKDPTTAGVERALGKAMHTLSIEYEA